MFRQWLIGLETTWVRMSVWVPILTAQSPNSGEVQSHLSTGIPPGACRVQWLQGHTLTWAGWERGAGRDLAPTERRASTQT